MSQLTGSSAMAVELNAARQTIQALRDQLADAEELRQAHVATINTAGDFLKRILDEHSRERDELRSQRDQAISELAEARKALMEVRRIFTESEYYCKHPTDRGECGAVYDCPFHAILETIDAARAATPADAQPKPPQEPIK